MRMIERFFLMILAGLLVIGCSSNATLPLPVTDVDPKENWDFVIFGAEQGMVMDGIRASMRLDDQGFYKVAIRHDRSFDLLRYTPEPFPKLALRIVFQHNASPVAEISLSCESFRVVEGVVADFVILERGVSIPASYKSFTCKYYLSPPK